MFVAHFARISSKFYLYPFTLIAIVSMIIPLVFIGSTDRTSAKGERTVEPAPDNAPPQPYSIGKGQSRASQLIESTRRQINEVLSPRELPEEFKIAKRPTFGERLWEKIGPALPLTAATAIKSDAPPAPTQPPGTVDFDYDEDAKSDVSRWDPVSKVFQITYSGGGGISPTFSSASSGAKPAPADYDADDKADAAVFDSGTWYIRMSGTGSTSTISSFGQAGDIPMSGNYIGSSSTGDELAVYRPSNGTWYWREVGTGTVYSQAWGSSGDIPVSGDFHTSPDGKLDFAVYRPSTGYWWILYSNGTGHTGIPWGIAIDTPVAADYDGDGRTDCAVFRPSTGTWWVLKSSDVSYFAVNWGNWADQPVVGDFDGDGQADTSVWRPSSGVWYVDHTDDTTFEYHTLGAAGDVAANSAYVTQVGGSVSSDALSLARLAPRNATGSTDLYSQNFAWGRNLVSLPGRSGLDLNIGLSYNSLVWTKEGSTVYFDTNYDNVTPGFNLGFATIEPGFYDSTSGKWNFLMITPSGARVQFRQTAASSVFETLDSSYLRLKMDPANSPADPPKEIQFEVYGTDGTRMAYSWSAGAFRCVKITDRNGNYLSMVYNLFGYLETATDTLGRIITVNYDTQFYPTSITQTWASDNGGGTGTPTHTWASFTYTTTQIQTDFSGVTVAGPPNGTYIKVLEKVIYPDTSWTKFVYNEYGQVEKVENYADDDHLLNYTETDLDDVDPALPDCPRFTETRTWAENFNLSGGLGTEQEVVVTNTAPAGDSETLPDSTAVSGKFVKVAVTGHPDGLYSLIWYGSSGFTEGLNLATQDCTGTNCAVVKRWTWNDWSHDDQYSSTTINPRVTETRVGDGTNTKRTTIDYLDVSPIHPVATFGLVEEVKVYAADLSTVIKKSTVEYNDSSTYTDRRILGLPSETKAWGWNDDSESLEYVSRATYEYDYDDDFAVSGMNQNISPVQHDGTNYGTSFSAGRGNMTKAIRWDVSDDDNSSLAVETKTLYNKAGSVVAKITPWDGTNTRTVKIGYTDVWNSSGNPTTYAYPTSITDPADNSSTVKYRYDIGANVEAESPAPAGSPKGKQTRRTFDSIGRLQKNGVWEDPDNNGWAEHSYTRYEYPTSGVQSKVYSTLIDTNANGPDSNDEVLSESWFDGAGRVRRSRVPHTFSSGSPVTWAGTLIEYDMLGRVKRQSVPTEVDSSFAAAGDDYSRGFVWNQQEYDWMGRTTRSIPSDSNGSDGKDTLISYAGCGCAGGLETTVQGPLVPRDDDPETDARRVQKSYADILGRTFKTEAYQWNGETVYSSAVNSFNGRDQVIKVTQTDHFADPDVVQESLASFDGHGRLHQSHRPEQRDGSNNPAYTEYAYNLDDSLSTKTDARGAVSTMTYNSRGLVTKVENELPSTPYPFRKNFALTSNGGTGSASSVYSSLFPIVAAFNGERRGLGWTTNSAAGWSSTSSFPNWLQATFDSEKTIDEINVVTLQDNYPSPIEPTEDTTFSQYGIVNFDVEYWDGDSWETVSGGSVTSNNKVLKKFTFSPISTTKIRVVVDSALSSVSRITELEAWGPDDTAPPVDTETNFTYDDLGNRLTMADEMGGVEYEYNSLSQLKSETRAFNIPMASAPLPDNKFKILYEYSLGTLKSYTDPFGQQIVYGRDKLARATDITGSSFGGVTTYAEDAERRAWGGLKSVTYTGGTELGLTYNSRLQVASMGLQKSDTSYLMNKTYEYYKDGKARFLGDAVDARFDRLNSYDHRGLITKAFSGGEARGETVATEDRSANLPYRQTFGFNAFGQNTASTNMHWGETEWQSVPFAQENDFVNNRIQKTGWEFDADGRNTKAISDSSEITLTTFDAAGRAIERISGLSVSRTYYDGNGAVLTSTSADPQKYQIRSSLLNGQVISEVWGSGKKYRSYVKGIGNQTAVQTAYATPVATLAESVVFEYSDALSMSYRTTDKDASAVATGDGGEGSPIETDPLGGSVGTSSPYLLDPIIYEPDPGFPDLQPFPSDGPTMPGPDFGSLYATFGSRIADLPGFGTNWGSFSELAMMQYDESVNNARIGLGFQTNEQVSAALAQLGINIDLPNGVRLMGFSLSFASGYMDNENMDLGEALRRAEGVGALVANWDEIDFSEGFWIEPRWSVQELVKGAREVIERALLDPKGKCAKLLGKNALSEFDRISKNMDYRPNITYGLRNEVGRELTLGENPTTSAVTLGETIYLNPNGYALTDALTRPALTEGTRRFHDGLNRLFKAQGASDQWEYALALVIHEFLHATGEFKPNDVKMGDDGNLDSSKSIENQKEVLSKCFQK
ncbi:MAG: hypothetical protein ABL984_03245 [Pyrinomonadaceae bacterium]